MAPRERSPLLAVKHIRPFEAGAGSPLPSLHGAGTFWRTPVHYK